MTVTVWCRLTVGFRSDSHQHSQPLSAVAPGGASSEQPMAGYVFRHIGRRQGGLELGGGQCSLGGALGALVPSSCRAASAFACQAAGRLEQREQEHTMPAAVREQQQLRARHVPWPC